MCALLISPTLAAPSAFLPTRPGLHLRSYSRTLEHTPYGRRCSGGSHRLACLLGTSLRNLSRRGFPRRMRFVACTQTLSTRSRCIYPASPLSIWSLLETLVPSPILLFSYSALYVSVACVLVPLLEPPRIPPPSIGRYSSHGASKHHRTSRSAAA